MTTLENLTLRRNAALARLSTLHRRAERLSAPAAAVISSALNELTSALEEMQVATEQLQEHVEQVAEMRHEAQSVREQIRELVDVLPIACVWTDAEGLIERANAAASELLNVSTSRLEGRPLVLFVTERQAFSDALAALNQGLTRAVALTAIVRPRERKPRQARMTGRRLEHDQRRCWFLTIPGESPHDDSE